ncbi:MAG: toll/interleukin-1 receptor domain-containing protein, partial [Acidobacteria bacterium]|nr:toll/interleukin-1 receptor domain-containing protein [Acidobacteriota bacterium]
MAKDVFLCHTGADKDWVEALAKRLEEETVDNRQIAVWFDKWDIDGGENILDKIEEGLKSSRFVGVVLSPAMTRAEWPRLEWQSQVYEDPAGRKARILPILRHQFDPVTGEPIEIPLPLRILKRYDFTNPKRFEAEFRDLLRRIRGVANPRGGTPTPAGPVFVEQEEPTGGEESLLTNEILSNVVDRPRELGGVLLHLSSSGLRFLLHAVDEAYAGAHER